MYSDFPYHMFNPEQWIQCNSVGNLLVPLVRNQPREKEEGRRVKGMRMSWFMVMALNLWAPDAPIILWIVQELLPIWVEEELAEGEVCTHPCTCITPCFLQYVSITLQEVVHSLTCSTCSVPSKCSNLTTLHIHTYASFRPHYWVIIIDRVRQRSH